MFVVQMNVFRLRQNKYRLGGISIKINRINSILCWIVAGIAQQLVDDAAISASGLLLAVVHFAYGQQLFGAASFGLLILLWFNLLANREPIDTYSNVMFFASKSLFFFISSLRLVFVVYRRDTKSKSINFIGTPV